MVNKNTRERERSFRDAQGKLYHDLAKLAFAGMFLAGIATAKDGDITNMPLGYVVFGLLLTVLLAAAGNHYFKH